MRREAGPGQTSEGTWRVQNLFGTNALHPVFEQTDTNWIAYNTAFPVGGDSFVVAGWRAGDANRIITLRVFSARDGAQVLELPTKTDWGNCLPLIDPTGQYLVCPPDGNTKARLLRLPGSNFVEWIDYPLAVSPSGQDFALPNQNGGCLLYDRNGRTNGLTLGLDSPMTLAPEFSLDGSRLAWGTREGTVLIANPQEVRRRLEQLRTSRR